jgi:hypothetical protein
MTSGSDSRITVHTSGRHEADEADDVDPDLRALGEAARDHVDLDVLLAQQRVAGREQEHRGEQVPLDLEVAFELVLNALRTAALSALISTAPRTSHATQRPIHSVTRSIRRERVSRGATASPTRSGFELRGKPPRSAA